MADAYQLPPPPTNPDPNVRQWLFEVYKRNASLLGLDATATLTGDVTAGPTPFAEDGSLTLTTVLNLPNVTIIDGGAAATNYTSQDQGPYGVYEEGVTVSGTVQTAFTQTSAAEASGNTDNTFFDDTIMQSGEGYEFMSLAVTPTDATNVLKIEVNAFLSSVAAAEWLIGGLFQDSTADSLATTAHYLELGTEGVMLRLVHWMVAGTASSTTFKFRAGMQTDRCVINGQWTGSAAARRMGGTLYSNLTVTEYEA